MLYVTIFALALLQLIATGEEIGKNTLEMSAPGNDETTCQVENQSKVIPMHKSPIKGALKLLKSDETSATIEWKALEGGEEYTVYYLEAMMADKPADKGPTLKCSEAGSTMSATITNLEKETAYTVYVSVQRNGKYFAYLTGLTVPKSR